MSLLKIIDHTVLFMPKFDALNQYHIPVHVQATDQLITVDQQGYFVLQEIARHEHGVTVVELVQAVKQKTNASEYQIKQVVSSYLRHGILEEV